MQPEVIWAQNRWPASAVRGRAPGCPPRDHRYALGHPESGVLREPRCDLAPRLACLPPGSAHGTGNVLSRVSTSQDLTGRRAARPSAGGGPGLISGVYVCHFLSHCLDLVQSALLLALFLSFAGGRALGCHLFERQSRKDGLHIDGPFASLNLGLKKYLPFPHPYLRLR